MSSVVIVAIGTDVGKTVVSAIFTKAMNAKYWKPVQAGDLDNSDSIKVGKWLGRDVLLPEKFRLNTPASPHNAAEVDGVQIQLSDLSLPKVNSNLVIETAGGVLVPLNSEGLLFADVVKSWNLPVVLVSRHYLGSINHTLLTYEALKSREIEIKGLVFIGDKNKATEEIITHITNLPILIRIPLVDEVNADFIEEQAELLKTNFK
ncbi:MAG: dethiobiotin synthase [Bacteroidota bacterium]